MAKDDQILRTNKKVDRMLKNLLSDRSFVKVGVLANPDNKAAPRSSDPKTVFVMKDGSKSKKTIDTSLVSIAIAHEFGDPPLLPQRSFLRSTFAAEKKNISKVFFKAAQRQIKKERYDPEDVLKLVGVWFEGRVKKTFTNNNWPRLKDPTRGGINPSGDATPLIDTNQLRASIASEVVKQRSGGAR